MTGIRAGKSVSSIEKYTSRRRTACWTPERGVWFPRNATFFCAGCAAGDSPCCGTVRWVPDRGGRVAACLVAAATSASAGWSRYDLRVV